VEIIKAGKAAIPEPASPSWCPVKKRTPGIGIRAILHPAATTAAGCAPAWLAYSGDKKVQML
jgi:hypothetical protein